MDSQEEFTTHFILYWIIKLYVIIATIMDIYQCSIEVVSGKIRMKKS